MNLCSVFVGEAVAWVVQSSASARFDLPAESPFAGWTVLSPLLVPEELGPLPAVLPMRDDQCMVISQFVHFGMNPGHHDRALEVAEAILRWMRLATGQPELENPAGAWCAPPDKLTLRELEVPPNHAKGRPTAHFDDKAITFERLRAAAALDPTCDVPVYAEMLMDALDAREVDDVRKAILCSAIAVEVMASIRTRELFNRAMSDSPESLRLLSRAQAGGSVVVRDPVFEELHRLAQRNFALLLEAVPLYVIRRSMLQENEQLYRELLRLHKTRNGIVHDAAPSEGRMPIDEEGMYRAIAAATGAFAWFDAVGRYPILPVDRSRNRKSARYHLRRTEAER